MDGPSARAARQGCDSPLGYAGETCRAKLERIRAALKERHACGMLVSALDDIAWTLNLRGTDVHCNPVFVAYLIIEPERATLFINKEKLTPGVEAYLAAEGVGTAGYADVGKALAAYGEYNILMDGDETCYTLYNMPSCLTVDGPSPIPAMKAVKNQTEIEGFRRAMLRDGVAMMKFLRWLRPAVEAGGQTEPEHKRKAGTACAPNRSYTAVCRLTSSLRIRSTGPSFTTNLRLKPTSPCVPKASCCSTRVRNTLTERPTSRAP